jgi:uncharacterized 2Fe-2S/4Fe-4S cluster protein (DUF4445 family)
MRKYRITFQPEGKKVSVNELVTIAFAAAEAGVMIDVPCGAVGKCGKCRVKVLSGVTSPDEIERSLISKDDLNSGIRLACRAKINGNAVVEIPMSSKLQTQKILEVGVETRVILNPAVKKVLLPLERTGIQRFLNDFSRKQHWSSVLLSLAEKKEDKATVVIRDNDIIDIEKGNTVFEFYGLAFDIGTTTIVGTLVDLQSGKVLATSADMNEQVIYGDDVISRLNYCIESRGLDKLNNKALSVINRLISDLCSQSGIMPDRIYDAVFAGNTTMEHLLLKVDPSSLAVFPFSSALGGEFNIRRVSDMGININSNAVVTVFPVIGGWVGGDTVSVILATDLYKSTKIKLAIDIGTNGEVVLGNKDKMLSTSCAAGPAFEGAHINFGMRASKGAIEKIDIIGSEVLYKTIEDAPARGFCGSGLIDAMAALAENGIVDESGRIKDPEELTGKLPKEIVSRIKQKENGNEFVFAMSSGKEISLNQKDVREIQLAKGAMFAGISILMKQYGIRKEDISEILMAGAFGNYIRSDKALAIGLIPDVGIEKIIFCGNAAEEGARKVLLSVDLKKDTEYIAKKTEHVELGSNSEFQNEFAEAMFFPVKEIA